MKLSKLLFAAISLAVAGPAPAQETILIRFSHVVAPETPKGRAALRFRDLAESYTRGRVKVEVHPDSRLYKDGEEFEALQRGTVEMLAPSLSKFGALVPQFEVFDLPYIFPNRATLHRVMDGAAGRDLLARLEPKGIVGLAFWDNGFKQMSANRPLRTVSAFAGLRMRVQDSRVLEAQMRALGAVPKVLQFSAVTEALRRGEVDGAENPVSNFYTQGMNAVQKHMTLSDHGYLGYAVISAKKFWDGLPSEVRTQLERAMADATAYEREIAQQENDDALAAVRKAGTTEVYVLPLQQRLAWHRVLQPVHREFEPVVGRDLLDTIYRTAEVVERDGAGR